MKSRYEMFIDSETFSEDETTAPVIDISAIIVDTEKMVSDNPYVLKDIVLVKKFKLDVNDQINNYGAIVSEGTLNFWKQQPKEVRAHIKPSDDDLSVKEFVDEFIKFLNTEFKLGRCWARNIKFDFTILKRLFADRGEKLDDHIKHYMIRDIRSSLDAVMAFDDSVDLNFIPIQDEEFWGKVFQHHNSTWDVMADVLRYQSVLRNDKNLEQINR